MTSNATTHPEVIDDYGVSDEPHWLGYDWTQHCRHTYVNDHKLNYIEVGDESNPPLLFIHGLSGCWQNWLENILPFAADYRVISVDLPGFGGSDMPSDGITISGYGRCIHAFCEKLGLEAVQIVGNSMGGFIAAEIAIQFPELAERIVLVSAAGISVNAMRRDPLITVARMSGGAMAALFARRQSIVVRPGLRKFGMKVVATHGDLLRPELCYEVMSGVGKPGFAAATEALLTYDFTERLPEIGCPTLIVWGRQDKLVPVRDAYEFERLIPGSRKVIMEDTGHVAMMERPKRFNTLLREFLNE